MADRKAELRDIVTRDYDEVRSLLQQLGDGTLQRKSENGWTIGEMAGHIAAMSSGPKFVVSRTRKGGNAKLPSALYFIVNVRNWFLNRKFKNTTKSDLLQLAETSHNEMIELVNSLDEEELDRGGDVLTLGRMTTYEYMKSNGDHGRGHAEEIRRALGIA